jgi:hypothetical protein
MAVVAVVAVVVARADARQQTVWLPMLTFKLSAPVRPRDFKRRPRRAVRVYRVAYTTANGQWDV